MNFCFNVNSRDKLVIFYAKINFSYNVVKRYICKRITVKKKQAFLNFNVEEYSHFTFVYLHDTFF